MSFVAARLCLTPPRNSSLLKTSALLLTLGIAGSATAATLCASPGGKHGCYATISLAVSAAAAGDVVEVYDGTYPEQVTITKSLSLVARKHADPVINAKGMSNGIFINGMGSAPNPGVQDVVVSGFKVQNANFEGILIANASNVTLVDNTIEHNNLSLDTTALTCPGIAAFETNEGEDCGEGIHLMAADHASIVRNEVAWNSGGILTSDETGPSHDNVISQNFVHDNQYDCGITFASHGPAVSVIPSATLPYGLMRNTIANNRSWRNGLKLPGAGAGIGIFAPFPGTTDAANVIIGNDVRDNGLPGITMHNHAYAPVAPPVNLNDNVIIGNYLSGNAADTADAATGGPTGINIYSVAPITGTIVLQNRFRDEAYGLVFKAPAGQVDAHFNNFDQGIGVDNLGAGTISATQNWWNCAAGPGSGNCAGVEGAGVTVMPWLTRPFDSSDDFEH